MQDRINHLLEYDYTLPFDLEIKLEDVSKIIQDAKISWTSNKCLHRKSDMIRIIAHHPKLISIIREILGHQFYLWGSSFIVSPPGHKHRYHVDAEHFHIKGVTVSIALENCSEENAFYFMSHSDAIPVSPQELSYENNITNLETIANQYSADSKHIELHMKPRECIAWKGRTWHSTENRSTKTRISLILQYAVSIPNIPVNYNNSRVSTTNQYFDAIFIDTKN